ncbi:MAG: S9 family peptidase [Ignavibacteriales bacterium]|nr:S9 family peptidase [Ignavibacteriales bacterium]
MDIGKETDIYIPRIKFTKDPGKLAIQRLDRLQQHLELLLADTKTGNTKVILQEQTTGWIDINNSLTFLNDNTFIWESEKDNFSHYYLYAVDGTLIRQITKGEFEDSELLGVDEKTSTLYYVSNERGVIYSDIYCIKTYGTGKRLMTPEKGTHSVSFSPDFAFFTDRYSNATTPSVLSLYSADGVKLRDLTKVTNNFSEKYDIGETSFLRFTTSSGVELQAMMIKPANFDPAKKYPVLFYNYSGPGSQTVKDVWDRQGLWHQLLAQKGYIIFQMDNRGTAGRGREFKHLLYKKLGTLEVEDLIEGAKYLSTLPYVDKSRIGIWGWSYGGYMSALTLMKGAEYFKMAVAVAPVTDWLFYDNIYTERFMSLPELNPEGYKNASVLESTDLLKGKLLIVHGTGDDNVHFQNSVKLVEKLIAGNKQFRTMYYPEKEHSIYGGKTRQHLFTMITEFILSEL